MPNTHYVKRGNNHPRPVVHETREEDGYHRVCKGTEEGPWTPYTEIARLHYCDQTIYYAATGHYAGVLPTYTPFQIRITTPPGQPSLDKPFVL
jgi:hypothetical protein